MIDRLRYVRRTEKEVTETPYQKKQYLIFAILALATIGATAVLVRFRRTSFQPYLGNVDPLSTLALATLPGFVSCFCCGWFVPASTVLACLSQ
jgi:hypothetical protein